MDFFLELLTLEPLFTLFIIGFIMLQVIAGIFQIFHINSLKAISIFASFEQFISNKPNKSLLFLDGVRSICCFLIILFHMHNLINV